MIIFNNRHRSTIHRIDPRFRVVVSAAFAILVVASSKWSVLLPAFAVSLTLAALARLSFAQVVKRLAGLNLFMLVLLLLLPLFIDGEPFVTAGPLVWSAEGITRALTIALRANSIMVALVSLLTTMEPAHLGFALNRTCCPEKLTHVLLFMVRYIEVIHREYHRLRDAMRLRGFRPRFDRHTLTTFGYLIGQLLVRSLDRSERILQAMKCRGFQGRFYIVDKFAMKAGDFAFAAVSVLFLLTWLEWR
ncbi:MAG: cobalt ECF transporter T component CbiQ [Planctomycetota bacterium]|jgi:cobalt/nickel transport system permease protein